jgi:CheY-like chemotaxis protein
MKKRVLLVDDDFAVLAGLAGVLVSEGYNVIHAVDGDEAVEKFRTGGVFDFVLLDLNMPKRSGWDAFEQITAIDPVVPVIVITARPDQYATAIAAGVDALMEKPLDLPVLLQKMERLMQESAHERLERRTGRNRNLLYCPAPKETDGAVFGQVINRAKATRRPWDRPEAAAPQKIDQPLDRLLKVWTSCSGEERVLFLQVMCKLAERFSNSAPGGSQIHENVEGKTPLVMDGARDFFVRPTNDGHESPLLA